MAISIDDDLKAAMAGDQTPIFLATLDPDGRPNCVPVTSITPYGDDHVIFAEFLMNKSKKNLLANNKVGIAVFSPAFEAWSLKGTFQGFETTGERVDLLSQSPMFRYNAYSGIRAAGLIQLEDISPKRRLTRSQVLFDYVRISAVAPFLRSSPDGASSPNGEAFMPRQVQEKFRRMAAVRAAAFRDSDGFPRAFPLLGCIPAGARRLLMSGPLFAPYEPELAPGTELAVAVLTMDPIAYQVKGVYRGKRAGLGVVDLTACYSASPPLLGDRLDGVSATAGSGGGPDTEA